MLINGSFRENLRLHGVILLGFHCRNVRQNEGKKPLRDEWVDTGEALFDQLVEEYFQALK
ncbi:MAG: hypothetical protein COB53_05285 [Elusimicrobia bacterium]|nr:MAG: hypothetical protein COB53_05285 [Elusimicrobiota bacterium]